MSDFSWVAFHEEGKMRFPGQWKLFCDTLIERGADAQIAGLIISLSNGVEVVRALFMDPAAQAELVSKKTRWARNLWLQRLSLICRTKPTRLRRLAP